MDDFISIKQWATNNGKSNGAHAKTKLDPSLIVNGKIPASTPWPFSPRKGGWTKGKGRKVVAEPA